MLNIWDVIVIGSGPAGSAASKVIAEAGYAWVFHRGKKVSVGGGFIYPLTKGGVHGAVWSGRIAGEVGVEALREGDPYRLSDYPGRVFPYPFRDRIHLSIPQTFFKFDNSIINTIGNIMNKKEYSEVPEARFLRYFLPRPTPRILWGIAVGFLVQRFYHKSAKFAW